MLGREDSAELLLHALDERLTKGREVVLNGRLGVESFTSAEGKEISKPIIKLVSFHLCGRKPEGAVPQAEVKQVAAANN